MEDNEGEPLSILMVIFGEVYLLRPDISLCKVTLNQSHFTLKICKVNLV